MHRNRLVPYTFILPYLTIFLLFWAWPIVYSIYLSFLDTRGFPWALEWGVNWGRILNDPFFMQALKNTLILLGVQVPIMLVLATGLAVALHSPLLGLKGFYRFAFFAPVVVGAVAYSAVFRLLFNTQNGAVNAALTGLGLPRVDWLNAPVPAFILIILTVTWRWTGYNAIIILAGLQNIPLELYEAAKIDGASPWQQFSRITLPLLRPILLFSLVLSVIGTLQLFTEPFLITGGGPGNATLTLGVYLYQQGFRSFNFGYASAIGYAIAAFAVLFSALQLRLFGGGSVVKRDKAIGRFWLHLLITPLALLWLAPLWLMFVFSTVPEAQIFSTPVPLLPGTTFMDNFRNLQADTDFVRTLLNSILVSSIYTLLSLFLTSMAGYAFARFRFFGRNALFTLVIATLTIPYAVVVIPQYILVAREFSLTNSYIGVVLPLLANSLGIFFMRQNFLSLPSSLLEAARIDGAGEYRIFFQIALPLVGSAMAALGIILFLAAWNDYLWPLLILTQKEMFTAPVALGTLIGLTRVSWGGIMVGAVLLTVPFLILFLFLQRYFVAGITAGAVKD